MKSYILPYLSQTQKSHIKITTNSGFVFYAHNTLAEYRYDEREEVIKNWRQYFQGFNNPPPEQDAYSVLLWYLFPDYLEAYNFDWICKRSEKKENKKHLYVLRNTMGFIKVGVAANVKSRIADLKYEFEGDFEVLKIHRFMGGIERDLHGKLMKFLKPILKRHNAGLSQECFEDCGEVLSICQNLS